MQAAGVRAIAREAISECVQLVRVTVTKLDGKTTTHTLDSEHHEVRDLKNHVGEKHGLECDAQNFSYAPTAGGTAKVSGDYLPDDELLKDGAALSLYVDKTQMERLEAVERRTSGVSCLKMTPAHRKTPA